MDMSFLLKQFLPPGVTVEMLQEQGVALVRQIQSAAEKIEATHLLQLEQTAMLRSFIATCQPPACLSGTTDAKEQNVTTEIDLETPSGLQSNGPGEPGQRVNVYPEPGHYESRSGNGDGGNAARYDQSGNYTPRT